MKKTWIKIKRGILQPKHREKLGVRLWLYLYILDRANWDDGRVYDWRDKDEARDFDMSWRTLQKQRQELENLGYITCVQHQNKQTIIINKWVNPREYGGKEYNTEGDTQKSVPLEFDEGTPEGTHEGTHKGSSKLGTPTLYSQITDQTLSKWKELFPNKPQPRKSTKKLQDKLKARSKDQYFMEIWEEAMRRASESDTCQNESWFDLYYFLHNETNFIKCYDRWMQWKDDKEYGSNNKDRKKEEVFSEEW